MLRRGCSPRSLVAATSCRCCSTVFDSGDEMRGRCSPAPDHLRSSASSTTGGASTRSPSWPVRSLAAGVMAVQGITADLAAVGRRRLIVSTATSGALITVLVVVVTINAVNFVDGLDGLAAGIVGIAAIAFFAVLVHPRRAARRGPRGDPAAHLGGAGRDVRRLPAAQLQPGPRVHGGHRVDADRAAARGLDDHADRAGRLELARQPEPGAAGSAAAAAAARRARGAAGRPAARRGAADPGQALAVRARTSSTCTTGCSRSVTRSAAPS